MQAFIIGFLNQFGYFGVAFLIAVDNIFPPIPSELILTFSGFMTTYSTMRVWPVILSATIGSVIGALVLYFIGRLITPEYLIKIFSGKTGKILHLKPTDISKAAIWFEKKGNLAVFVCRFIPILRSLISIPAGAAKMKLGTFLYLTAIGSAIWNTVLVWLGVFAGESWVSIVQYMNIYTVITLAVLGLLFLTLVFIFYKKRLKTTVGGTSEKINSKH